MPEIQGGSVVRATLENLGRVNAVSLINGVGIRLHIFTLAPDKLGYEEVIVDFKTSGKQDGYWHESLVFAHPVLNAVLALLEAASGQKFTKIDTGRHPLEMYYRADMRASWDELMEQRRQEASPGPTLP